MLKFLHRVASFPDPCALAQLPCIGAHGAESGMPNPRSQVPPDIECARLVLCARLHCRRQFSVCGRCDHGRRYCGAACAAASRRESLRRAGRAYQRSERSRQLYAARQARYRTRRAQVTHHRPLTPLESLPLPAKADLERRRATPASSTNQLALVCQPEAGRACLVCEQPHVWHRVRFRACRPRRAQRFKPTRIPIVWRWSATSSS